MLTITRFDCRTMHVCTWWFRCVDAYSVWFCLYVCNERFASSHEVTQNLNFGRSLTLLLLQRPLSNHSVLSIFPSALCFFSLLRVSIARSFSLALLSLAIRRSSFFLYSSASRRTHGRTQGNGKRMNGVKNERKEKEKTCTDIFISHKRHLACCYKQWLWRCRSRLLQILQLYFSLSKFVQLLVKPWQVNTSLSLWSCTNTLCHFICCTKFCYSIFFMQFECFDSKIFFIIFDVHLRKWKNIRVKKIFFKEWKQAKSFFRFFKKWKILNVKIDFVFSFNEIILCFRKIEQKEKRGKKGNRTNLSEHCACVTVFPDTKRKRKTRISSLQRF